MLADFHHCLPQSTKFLFSPFLSALPTKFFVVLIFGTKSEFGIENNTKNVLTQPTILFPFSNPPKNSFPNLPFIRPINSASAHPNYPSPLRVIFMGNSSPTKMDGAHPACHFSFHSWQPKIWVICEQPKYSKRAILWPIILSLAFTPTKQSNLLILPAPPDSLKFTSRCAPPPFFSALAGWHWEWNCFLPFSAAGDRLTARGIGDGGQWASS